MSRLQWYLRNNFIFPLYILSFFFISIHQFIPQFINVIAPAYDLLMDELTIYFTQNGVVHSRRFCIRNLINIHFISFGVFN